jgi:ketosteroid isomerase-like protein
MSMARRIVFLSMAVLIGLFCVRVSGHAQSAPSVQAEIERALDVSAADWSQGKLGDFMKLYDDSPDTLLVGGDKIVSGYREIQSRYAAHYGEGDAKAMGQLKVEILQFRELTPTTVFVVMRYHLRIGDQPTEASGLSTLVFQKKAPGWRIVSDHSD